MLVKQKSLSHSCEKGFCIYYDSVQIYASGFLTPAVRNDNGNDNQALQSHKSSQFLSLFAAKVNTLFKNTNILTRFFSYSSPSYRRYRMYTASNAHQVRCQ